MKKYFIPALALATAWAFAGCRQAEQADTLPVIDMGKEQTVTKDSLLYKCGWSPYEGCRLRGRVDMVFVNGEMTVSGGKITGSPAGRRLFFGQDIIS